MKFKQGNSIFSVKTAALACFLCCLAATLPAAPLPGSASGAPEGGAAGPNPGVACAAWQGAPGVARLLAVDHLCVIGGEAAAAQIIYKGEVGGLTLRMWLHGGCPREGAAALALWLPAEAWPALVAIPQRRAALVKSLSPDLLQLWADDAAHWCRWDDSFYDGWSR